ncbi:MAG: lipopolysaccharide biosynthesis protein, partial [Gemmatimonadales bacterium]
MSSDRSLHDVNASTTDVSRTASGRNRRLAADTAWMVSGYSARIALQAAYFLLLARSLGSGEYGAFVSTVAIIGIGAPLAGLGAGHILVRDASRNPALLRTALANALTVAAFGGVALAVLLLPVLAAVAPNDISLLLLLLVLLADGVGGPLAEVCAQAFQAAGRIRISAFLQFSPSALRFAAVVWFSTRVAVQGVAAWTAAYATAGIVATLVAMAIVTYAFRPPRPSMAGAFGMIREGWYFSIMAAAQMANSDVDKPLVARLSSVDAAGVYAAAYRIVDVAFAPVRALMYSSYATFFAHGALGVRSAMSFAGRLARLSLG